MKKIKVIIIMTVVLMVLNASASELQHFFNEPINSSELASKTDIVEKQELTPIVLLEGATNFCEEKIEDS